MNYKTNGSSLDTVAEYLTNQEVDQLDQERVIEEYNHENIKKISLNTVIGPVTKKKLLDYISEGVIIEQYSANDFFNSDEY